MALSSEPIPTGETAMADDRKTDEDVTSPHLVRAYRRMLERAREILENETRPSLKDAVDRARKSTVELGEVTREEADQVAGYLKRDLHDAGDYLSLTGRARMGADRPVDGRARPGRSSAPPTARASRWRPSTASSNPARCTAAAR